MAGWKGEHGWLVGADLLAHPPTTYEWQRAGGHNLSLFLSLDREPLLSSMKYFSYSSHQMERFNVIDVTLNT